MCRIFYFCFVIVNYKIFEIMKFFIDTANLAQIREANEMGVLDGVTTNPSLMAKEGIKGAENCKKHYVEICNIVNGDVSAEVIATDYEGMIKEGDELAQIVHWYFLRDKLCWLLKLEQPMFLRL